MDYCQHIPVPVSYNPLKHHFSHQLSFISQAGTEITGSFEDRLMQAGDNVIDVYAGDIEEAEVAIQVISILSKPGIVTREELNSWLGYRGYKEVFISDGSKWVIRLSENAERFVHIHPGKRSVHTFRLRGTTLKTVLALCILPVNQSGNNVPDIEIVNNVRKESLGLSPVKNLSENGNILKWFNFYRNLLNS